MKVNLFILDQAFRIITSPVGITKPILPVKTWLAAIVCQQNIIEARFKIYHRGQTLYRMVRPLER